HRRRARSLPKIQGSRGRVWAEVRVDRSGRISRCGDDDGVMLYEATQSMLRSKKWSWLKAWAMQIARRRGMKKAIVALARRLAGIMHRIWLTPPSSAGPGTKPRQKHENLAGSNPIERKIELHRA